MSKAVMELWRYGINSGLLRKLDWQTEPVTLSSSKKLHLRQWTHLLA